MELGRVVLEYRNPEGIARMDHDAYPDRLIGTILDSVKTIAMVGASAHQARPSFAVLRYLVVHGYRVFPINRSG